MKRLLIISSIFLFASALPAQEGVVSRLSPAPLWPRNGSVPLELSGQSIFFNPDTNQVVVLPDAAEPGAQPITFELRNQTVATVSTSVTQDTLGRYVYQYRLGASAGSRRALQQWSLLVPTEDARFAVQTPALWTAQSEETAMVDRPAPKHLLLKYIHFIASAGTEIPVAASVPGFRLVSSNLPGYVTSFARSRVDRPFSSAALTGVSKNLSARVATTTAPEWDSQLRLVIGPRFLPETETLTIAAGFHYALEHFLSRQELQEDSNFVKGAMASLEAYMQVAISGPFRPGQLEFLSAAQTPLEKEMAQAMAISLTAGK
jgi:hypothetical protein